jgi:hypothetical protein
MYKNKSKNELIWSNYGTIYVLNLGIFSLLGLGCQNDV